jgi:hypothetical protein
MSHGQLPWTPSMRQLAMTCTTRSQSAKSSQASVKIFSTRDSSRGPGAYDLMTSRSASAFCLCCTLSIEITSRQIRGVALEWCRCSRGVAGVLRVVRRCVYQSSAPVRGCQLGGALAPSSLPARRAACHQYTHVAVHVVNSMCDGWHRVPLTCGYA